MEVTEDLTSGGQDAANSKQPNELEAMDDIACQSHLTTPIRQNGGSILPRNPGHHTGEQSSDVTQIM